MRHRAQRYKNLRNLLCRAKKSRSKREKIVKRFFLHMFLLSLQKFGSEKLNALIILPTQIIRVQYIFINSKKDNEIN